MWWRHGWACTLLRCLSGIVVATALIVRGSAFGAGLVSLALWQPNCQPLHWLLKCLLCRYVTAYIVLFPLENHDWLLGNIQIGTSASLFIMCRVLLVDISTLF